MFVISDRFETYHYVLFLSSLRNFGPMVKTPMNVRFHFYIINNKIILDIKLVHKLLIPQENENRPRQSISGHEVN